MRYYCPQCHHEVVWNDELKGFKCDYCSIVIDELEVEMEEDNEAVGL